MSKIAYSFDIETGSYTGPVMAQESPLEPGDHLRPLWTTYTAPPTNLENEVAVFAANAVADTRDLMVASGAGEWSVVPDYRGQVIYDQSSAACEEMLDIGPIPAGWALTVPPITLGQAQAAQIAAIDAAYATAVQVSVTFKTAAGVTKTYQADNQGPLSSQSVLLKTYTGYNIDGATPAGFYWQAEDNTQVPFTLTDLGGLYKTMLAQGNAAFSQRAALKAAIRAAITVAAVQAITWS